MQKIHYILLALFTYITSIDGQSDYFQNRLIVEFVNGTTQQDRQLLRDEYDANLIDFLPKLNVEIWEIRNFPVMPNNGSMLNDIIEVQGNATRKAKVNGSGLDYETQYPENDLDECQITPFVYDPLPCCAPEDVVTCGVDTNFIKVGIIDTGADLISPQPFYFPYNVTTSGYDFVNNTLAPIDRNGHGTQMTSIIGGILDKQAAPNVNITPLKALGASGTGSLSNIIRAVEFAICDTVNILNMSLGYKADKADLFDDFFKNILQKAIDNNILVIVAAGNLGECIGLNNPYYPASFDLDGMLTIGASECTAGYAPFSNYGQSVDLLAPGVKVFCRDTAFGNWIYANGTSHAAAIASGMAASLATEMDVFDAATVKNELLLELNPCISNILDADITCHPSFGLVDNLMLNFNPPVDSMYSALDTLSSTAVLPIDTRITYKAGEAIILEPGFYARNGTCFAAAILDCDPYSTSSDIVVTDPFLVEDTSPNHVLEHQKGLLFPNYPNPFYEQTSIPYFIPETAKNAYIKIINTDGKVVKFYPLEAFGSGELLISEQLKKGLYFGLLYIENELIDSQKLIVLK